MTLIRLTAVDGQSPVYVHAEGVRVISPMPSGNNSIIVDCGSTSYEQFVQTDADTITGLVRDACLIGAGYLID